MNRHGDTQGFHASGNARDLVETCINDLRMNAQHSVGVDVEAGDAGGMGRMRREAVIILYASGAVGVFEGWNVKRDDIPELLAAKVLRDG